MTAPTPAPAGATYTDKNGETVTFVRWSYGFMVVNGLRIIPETSPAYAHFAALYPPGSDASYVPEKEEPEDICGKCLQVYSKHERGTGACPEGNHNDTSLPALMALENLLRWAENNVCTHEETHRGGVLWEICDSCGAMWADDKGGKPPFEWPSEIVEARQALEATRRLASK